MRTVSVSAVSLLAMLLSGGATAGDRSLRPEPVVGLLDCAGGGVVLPGSDTCLSLGGSVRAEATVGSRERPPSTRSIRQSLTHFGATARVELDARTPTAMGPFRVFTSVRLHAPAATAGP